MTGREAVLRLKVKINQLDTASNRTVRPEKALLFLNDAYEKLAQAKYKRSHINDGSAFQLNQLATDELNHLTKVVEIVPVVTGDEAAIDIASITDYWVHLRSALQVKSRNTIKWITDPNYMTLDTIGTAKEDPFNSPIASKPIVFFEENKIKVLTDGFSVLKHKITYYSKPQTITLESELSISFIDEIIDIAATTMLENWGDPRFQSKAGLDAAVEQK